MKTNAGASTGARAIHDLHTFDLTVRYADCCLILSTNLIVTSLVFFNPERTTLFFMEVVGRRKVTRNPNEITIISPAVKVAWIIKAVPSQVFRSDSNGVIFAVPRISIKVGNNKILKAIVGRASLKVRTIFGRD